ncbi:uncharacterized protein LOC129106091 [Anoplopoma fimbria]|uniref:uncharacterized protein LOC129106091 n=1 Tax=Anoplopoma fimbria TaxID=229290 RepID=UPI0023ECC1FB|nr:uncharacterized protein LOC129106091 [Anoplopoma fimbria]
MDSVLEGAALLCVCKLACSLPFLPSLARSNSPVSFCCCCLLVFTDFLVAVFLTFLCISESWLTEQTPHGDVVALRFLIFLSHTYGGVLLLTVPLIAVDTLTRLLWPRSVVAHRTRTVRQTVGSDGQRCYVWEVTGEEEEDSEDNRNKEKGLSHHDVSYLCCLSVWVVVALNVRWRWKREEAWAADCLHTTNSLVRCLPNLLSPMSSTLNPCWGITFLSVLLLLLTVSTGLHCRHRAPAQTTRTRTEKRGVNNNDSDSRWQDLASAMSGPSKPPNTGMPEPEPALCVDPGKTESSCTVHRAYSWNGVQMSAHHHGDFVFISPECLSAERRGQEHERTKNCIPLTFITEDVDAQNRSQSGWGQWGFPCPGVNVIGFVCVLFIFVLPLNLSVNILLIRTIETLLELCIKYLLSSAANTSNASTSHNETLV